MHTIIIFFHRHCVLVSRLVFKLDSFKIDVTVRKMARILAKLSSGDMIAIDAACHKQCLTNFRDRYRIQTESEQILDLAPDAIALAELISFIEETHQSENQSEHIFKLSNLVQLCRSKLEQLGGNMSERTHATRLKEKLLIQIPDLEAHKGKYDSMLPFKYDVGERLLDAKSRDQESDVVVLIRAGNIDRKEIFQEAAQH